MFPREHGRPAKSCGNLGRPLPCAPYAPPTSAGRGLNAERNTAFA